MSPLFLGLFYSASTENPDHYHRNIQERLQNCKKSNIKKSMHSYCQLQWEDEQMPLPETGRSSRQKTKHYLRIWIDFKNIVETNNSLKRKKHFVIQTAQQHHRQRINKRINCIGRSPIAIVEARIKELIFLGDSLLKALIFCLLQSIYQGWGSVSTVETCIKETIFLGDSLLKALMFCL